MRVVILHNTVAADASAADRDVLVQAQVVGQALVELGHQAFSLACTLDLHAARQRLLELQPDVVFNLVESLDGLDALQGLAPAMLEALEIPYTGASAAAFFLAVHKLRAKRHMRLWKLPTPDWRVADPELAESAAPLPCERWIIKTIAEHASFGLDEESVGRYADERSLQRQLAAAAQRLGRPCFAEQYVDGREFNLSVLCDAGEPQVLPPAEIDFSAFPAGKVRVVGQRAKWDEATFEFQATPRRFDFPAADAPLLDELHRLALDCWRPFELRGYVRVDFRVDAANRPWILEINTNPCLSPDAGFYAALGQAGLNYRDLATRLLDDARR